MERSSGSGTRIRVRDPPTFYHERTTAVTMSTSATTSVHRVELDGRLSESLVHVERHGQISSDLPV